MPIGLSLPSPARRLPRGRSWSIALAALALAARSPAAPAPIPSPLQAGPRQVAVLETRAPAVAEFILRGTVPLPRGVYHADDENPFTVLDYDARPVFTQVEVVSRYPDPNDGADVVELLARVRRNPAHRVGERARYSVVLGHPAPAPLDSLDQVPEIVNEFLLDPRSVEIAAYDCFGNRYVCRPIGAPNPAALHKGPVLAEMRVHQAMVPQEFVEGSTLPHLLGVHAYVSWGREQPTVGIDLRLHNGHDGHDSQSKLDDPLDKIYFRRIELSIPANWVLMQDFDDPLFGAERFENGRRIVALVAPNSNGLHVMRWQAQFHRRLALAPLERPGAVQAARAQLDGAGRAFCTRGVDDQGRPFWSWWNENTARYFPQRHQLPRLDHVGRSSLENEIERELEFLAGHLAEGTGSGDYPLSSGRLGWGHPYGVTYGGMTSGLEINCYDGIVAAAAADPRGFRLYSLLHRMQTDRMPNALYQRNGEPSSVEEWLVEQGNADYLPFDHFVVPQLFGSHPDPFGVRTAPRFQVDFVQANGLQPGYESRHLSFDPYDYQHFIRYTRSAKVLAWLANDSLAIDDLRMQAENFNLSYHDHPNDPYGNGQTSGMLSAMRFVARYPGRGFGFGRGEAWGLDCASAAYSLASPEWRARKLPWLQRIAELVLDGQNDCSGFIQAMLSEKAVGGDYRARQAIEQSITENALVGLHESVFREALPGHAAMVRAILVDSLRAFIGEMSWFPGEYGPWRYTGVGPRDAALPTWCSRAEMPNDAWTAGDIEAYQDWSSFGYGYELTGDPVFLRYARIQMGVADFEDLVRRLRQDGTENIHNRAALLAVVQRLVGEL